MTWIYVRDGLWHRAEESMGERATTCGLVLAGAVRESAKTPDDLGRVCWRCRKAGAAGDKLQAYLDKRRAVSAQKLAATLLARRRLLD
jgi:hypothetical protein